VYRLAHDTMIEENPTVVWAFMATLPIWTYIPVTGVVIYWMLYRID